MHRSVRITVHPSRVDSGLLTVSDALLQVHDFFKFIERLEDTVAENRSIVWKLSAAHTNSPPFTVDSRAYPNAPGASIESQADRVLDRARTILSQLVEGSCPDSLERVLADPLVRFIARNMNGIRQTDILIDKSAMYTLTSQHASAAAGALARLVPDRVSQPLEPERTEFGSFEGEVYSVSKRYTRPAMQIVERLSGRKVTCIMDNQLAQILGLDHKWSDVWEGCQLTLTGKLYYRPDGSIKLAEIASAKDIEWADVQLKDLPDVDILEGRSVSEHLRRLWGD